MSRESFSHARQARPATPGRPGASARWDATDMAADPAIDGDADRDTDTDTGLVLIGSVRALGRLSLATLTESLGLAQVTLVQYRVLVVLAECGRMTLSEVASDLGVSSPRAQRVCRVLEARGLIGIRRPPGHEWQVALSGRGEALVTRVEAERWAAIRDVASRLSPNECEEVVRSLSLFGAAAQEVPDEHWPERHDTA